MSAKRKNALGRGLGALLDESSAAGTGLLKKRQTGSSVNDIALEEIETNPYQPRSEFDAEALTELAESIKTQGIIQPITVRKLADKQYQLISGERRLQAAKQAGLKTIPAYVRTANDQQMLEMAIIENIQREDLNAIEIALSYQRLMSECQLTQEELAERVGKKRSTVTNYLRLLKLPPDIQAAIRDKKISMGHARALISIENTEAQLEVYRRIIKNDLSVRQVEQLARLLAAGEEKPASEKGKSTTTDPVIRQLQNKLSSHFGTKVVLNANERNQGSIKIPFNSAQDLNRILEILDIRL